jgi:hypothetical protein
LTRVGFSQAALGKLLSNILFFKNGFDFSGFNTSEDLDDVFGELKPSNWDDLPANAFSVDQNSLIIEDIDNGGKFSCISSVINSGDATDFYEFGVSLNKRLFTIWNCGELY